MSEFYVNIVQDIIYVSHRHLQILFKAFYFLIISEIGAKMYLGS